MDVGMMMVFASYGWEDCSDDRVWKEEIRLARLAADAGFDCLWSAEHHFNDYSFVPDNLALMNGLALLHGLGCPIVLGASRKRTIGALDREAPADQRLAGSLAFALKAVEQGAQILRVHDVPETVQALRIWRGLRDEALTPRQPQ